MGIFSKFSGLGDKIKTKFADDDFRDKLNGIGSALQGDDKAYETYSKRKSQRTAADDVANAIARGEMPEMPVDPNAYQSDLGQVQMPKLLANMQRRPGLPVLPTSGPTFLRRY